MCKELGGGYVKTNGFEKDRLSAPQITSSTANNVEFIASSHQLGVTNFFLFQNAFKVRSNY